LQLSRDPPSRPRQKGSIGPRPTPIAGYCAGGPTHLRRPRSRSPQELLKKRASHFQSRAVSTPEMRHRLPRPWDADRPTSAPHPRFSLPRGDTRRGTRELAAWVIAAVLGGAPRPFMRPGSVPHRQRVRDRVQRNVGRMPDDSGCLPSRLRRRTLRATVRRQEGRPVAAPRRPLLPHVPLHAAIRRVASGATQRWERVARVTHGTGVTSGWYETWVSGTSSGGAERSQHGPCPAILGACR
jgi:hypothetical protein